MTMPTVEFSASLASPTPGVAGPTVVAAVAPDDNDDVLRVAWVRASTMGLRLVVCSVVAEAAAFTAAYEALLQRTRSLLPRDAEVEVEVRIGDRVEGVLACVGSNDAALLVLGTSSQREGVLARFFSPGLPTAMMRGAPCPILVIRYSPATGRILAATDLGDPSRPVLRAAAQEVARCGGQVFAVHCVAPLPMTATMDVPAPMMVRTDDLIEGVRDELELAVAEVGLPPGVLHVEVGTPASTILDLARELAVDLIIVGTHGRSGTARLLLGSVAEAVLRDAICNVMVVRLGSPSADPA